MGTKSCRMKMAIFSGLLSFSIITPLVAQSGFIVGPPSWTSTSIQTTGGITYFTHVATLPDCNWINAAAVPPVGTNITLNATEMQGFLCPECVDCVHTETHVTVLGQLPPGKYRMNCYAPGPTLPPSFPFRTMDFDVPTNTGPTLVATPGAGVVNIQLNGLPVASYTIQASANFTNWVTVTNVTGGPTNLTLPSATLPYRFYRANIADGTLVTR